jgi:hypothetical protein
MTQMSHAVTSARTAQAKNAKSISDLSGRISTAEAELILFSPYGMVCSTYLTGPNGGPATFYFPCSAKRVTISGS